MLNPQVRSIYTAALRPPPGMRFEEAIATAYSMDPSMLLQAPVYLALMFGDDGRAQNDALYALEAIRRHSDRITAYVQRGRIVAPQRPTSLYSLLEEMTVEVKSPNGGVFHPKLWLIRFVATSSHEQMLRLVVLSRNLTADRSWDLSLQLEGLVGKRARSENKPLAELIRRLPEWSTSSIADTRSKQARRMADDLRKVDWDLPDGFDEDAPTFYVPGLPGHGWTPEPSRKLAIISPFCSRQALEDLAATSDEPITLISRPEALAELDASALETFDRCLCLDDAAETEDGEDATVVDGDATGLHAKAFIYERRYYKDYTHIVVGSANATDAALVHANNIELLVELVGRTETVGGVDALIGSEGLGEFLVPFAPGDAPATDAARVAAEQAMESARNALSNAGLAISCSRGDADDQYRLILRGAIPDLGHVRVCTVWPITLGDDHAVRVRSGEEDALLAPAISPASVTGLTAFHLETDHHEVSCRFVLNLVVHDIPAERHAAVLQTIINNERGFLRYLLLLLGDDSSGPDLRKGSGGTFAKWLAALGAGDDVPLLEELTRTFCRTPARLNEVRRLIHDLTSNGVKEQVVPERFLSLWSVFERAMEEQQHER